MDKNFFEGLQKNKGIFFTKQQKQAITHKRGPALVLAVPGSGKTTTLITRVAYLIDVHNIDPRSILSLTFSKAAAGDMKGRYQQLYGKNQGGQPHFSTIHSFAHQVLKREFHHQGLTYHLIEGKNAPVHKNQILQQLYYLINKEYIKEEILEELANNISFVKNRMLSPRQMKEQIGNKDHFYDIYQRYESWKRERRYIDFDDMLTLSYGILKKNKALREAYAQKYSYIQVDEGQDTSPIQYALLKLLAYPRKNIFIVADDDQSIYGFRGADPKELMDFKNLYPKGKIFYMEENFRSTKSIVHVTNEFIKANEHRHKKHMKTQRQEGKPIIIKRTSFYREQMDYLIQDIQDKGQEDTIAILYRNNLSTISLMDNLLRANIPFSLGEGKKIFFGHWLTKDILAFINLALDHRDLKSFERIYYKMNQYISKKTLDYLKETPGDQSLFYRLKNMEEVPDFQRRRMVELEEKFLILGSLSPIRAMEYIEKDLCYDTFLQSHMHSRPAMINTAIFILDRLKNIARNTSSLVDFLCRIEDLKSQLEEKSHRGMDSSKVLLSTFHGAKGLEFDRVYMIDLEEKQIPTYHSIKQEEKGEGDLLEEERRLFYVAMTRAKNELTLMGVQSSHNATQECSRFVKEVQECIKKLFQGTKERGYFKEKDQVIHRKFGKGKIKWIQDHSALIEFEDSGLKKMDIHFCTHGGLLEKVQ